MTNRPYLRSALVKAALDLMPPLVRKTLIENVEFREEYGFTADAVISLGDSGVDIQRSNLFNSVRKILAGASVKGVSDKNGQKWRIKSINSKGELPRLELSRGKKRLMLPDFCSLSSDQTIRLTAFDAAAFDVNLPSTHEMRGAMFFQNVLSKMMTLICFMVNFAILRFKRLDPYAVRLRVGKAEYPPWFPCHVGILKD